MNNRACCTSDKKNEGCSSIFVDGLDPSVTEAVSKARNTFSEYLFSFFCREFGVLLAKDVVLLNRLVG